MFKIPTQAWPRIDAAINAAIRKHNEGVPDCGREAPIEYAVERDVQSKRLVVSAVRFPSGLVRARIGAGEEWRAFK